MPDSDGAFSLRAVSDAATAKRSILNDDLFAAVALGATGDELFIASAASPSIADLISRQFAPAVSESADGVVPRRRAPARQSRSVMSAATATLTGTYAIDPTSVES